MAGDSSVRHFRWDQMEKERVTDLIHRRVISGEKAMVAHIYLKKGAVVPMHSHHNEQVTYLLEGALKFWIGEEKEELVLRAGEVLAHSTPCPPRCRGSRGLPRCGCVQSSSAGLVGRDRRLPPRQVTPGRTGPQLLGNEHLTMDLGLKGKVALATASSEGIGRAVAEALAAEGADLVVCARREGPLDDARKALEQYGRRGSSCSR